MMNEEEKKQFDYWFNKLSDEEKTDYLSDSSVCDYHYDYENMQDPL